MATGKIPMTTQIQPNYGNGVWKSNDIRYRELCMQGWYAAYNTIEIEFSLPTLNQTHSVNIILRVLDSYNGQTPWIGLFKLWPVPTYDNDYIILGSSAVEVHAYMMKDGKLRLYFKSGECLADARIYLAGPYTLELTSYWDVTCGYETALPTSAAYDRELTLNKTN